MSNTDYYIKSYCSIKNQRVSLNGSILFKDESKSYIDFIKATYKNQNVKYPKFFKMDNLSKLAFLAADVLLKNEDLNTESENNIAIVFSNSASSLDTDEKHQESIQKKDNDYPSPAVFVYTLDGYLINGETVSQKGNVSLIR